MHTVTKKLREWKVGEATESFEYGEQATDQMAHEFIGLLAQSLRTRGREPIVLSVSLKITGMLLVERVEEGDES